MAAELAQRLLDVLLQRDAGKRIDREPLNRFEVGRLVEANRKLHARFYTPTAANKLARSQR